MPERALKPALPTDITNLLVIRQNPRMPERALKLAGPPATVEVPGVGQNPRMPERALKRMLLRFVVV